MAENKSNTSKAIGIDLGTTFSCVAGFISGRIEVINDSNGDRTTPSIVFFEQSGNRVVGDPAKELYADNPSNFVFDAKRMIGRSFDDKSIQDSVSKWPFKIVRYDFVKKCEDPVPSEGGFQDNIAIKIETTDGVKYYSPVEISATVLTHLKKAAEAKLGGSIDAGVITVPAYFSDVQRERTKLAAQVAGFDPSKIRLVAEPTAAAMAYGHVRNQESGIGSFNEEVLVFDLGGGTFDVTVINFTFNADDSTGTVGIVKATEGITTLGGQDFDVCLMNYCLERFLSQNKDVKESDINEGTLLRLRAECTRAKAVLSSSLSTKVTIPCFYKLLNMDLQVTRAKFESLCEPLFRKCMERVKGCLLLANGAKNVQYDNNGDKLLLNPQLEKELEEAKTSIDKVLLVGGSSRIPKVKELISNYFGANRVCEPVNADEAIAFGAARQAASLYSDANVGGDLLLIDCTPLDLSIETAGGVATVVVPRNTSIPTKKTETFTTYEDNQSAVTINVFEGNRPMAKDNNKIGSFNLGGIIPAPRGTPKISVTFDINNNGILVVSARDESTNNTENLTINNTQSRMSDEEIQRMRDVAKEHEKIDEEIKTKVNKKNNFEQTLYGIRSAIGQANVPQEQKDNVLNEIMQHEEWLENIKGTDYSLEELENRSNSVQEIMKKIAGQAQQPPQQ